MASQQVAAQELDLVGDDRLVLGAVVDVEVVDAGVGAQLAQRRAPGGGDRRARLGDPVGLADADQPGAVQRRGVAGGRKGRPSSQREETRLRQRESSPPATTRRQPASPPGALMKAASSGCADRRQVRAAQRRGQQPRRHRGRGAVRLA